MIARWMEIEMRLPILYNALSRDVGFNDSQIAFLSALELSKLLDAKLDVVVGAIQISVPNIWNSTTVAEIVHQEHLRSLESAAMTVQKIEALALSGDKKVETLTIKGDFGQLKSAICGRARCYAFAVTERGDGNEPVGSTFIEPLLFESGRPVMILPHAFNRRLDLERVVVAWDGSISAARALWDALDFLRLAKSIDVVTVTGEKPLPESSSANFLIKQLAFLGDKLRGISLPCNGASAAASITRLAEEAGAGLIVQGAYGHSKWRELILGGATRETLIRGSIPVFLSHQG